jgi:hypothetical protein
MANFARIDKDNIVVQLVKIDTRNNVDSEGVEREHIGAAYLKNMYGTEGWIQTSFNKTFRKNYAMLGGVYDKELDMFLKIKMYPSWVINHENGEWTAPVQRPTDNNKYSWNESACKWDLVN